MHKYTLILPFLLLLASCSPVTERAEPVRPHVDEVVDIRIDGEGLIRFNGNVIHESALASHVQALHTSEKTKARFIFSGEAPTGVVNKAVSLLYRNGVGAGAIRSKMLSPEEFAAYDRQNIHIDVLSSGKIFYRGHELFPADLSLALEQTEQAEDAIVRLSVSEEATVGPVTDLQQVLRHHGLMRINYGRL